jgi:excisionase family DNA binding protein
MNIKTADAPKSGPSPIAHSIQEATQLAGCGRTTLHHALKSGSLRGRKLGRRTIILADDLRDWLKSLPPVAA